MTTIAYYIGLFALIVGALVAVSIPLSISDERTRKRKITAAFAGRDPLDDRAFFEKYYASRGVPADVVSKIRRVLADVLDFDVSRIRPNDDFTRNLAFFFRHGELLSVYIVEDLEKEFGISITDAEAAEIHTVDDIVFAVGNKLRQRAA